MNAADDEPLYCQICGAEDWECGHQPYAAPTPDHGPDAYCEVDRCRLWLGERCGYCMSEEELRRAEDTSNTSRA